jgi:uncharacterized protein
MNRTPHSRLRRTAIVGGAASAAVLLAAGPALAHVSVQPGSAAKGSYSTVVFKVPNEQDNASTVKIEVNLPTDHPVPSVSVQPVPGWTTTVTKSKLSTPLKTDDGTVNEAITKITWSGGKIGPGQFQQFPVSFGPLPTDTDELAFKTLQTYDNKDVVRWIQLQQKGQPEPDNPAPVLHLTDASGGDGASSASSASAAPATATSAVTKDVATGNADTTARTLGIVGIVVGVLGVAFGVTAGRRRGTDAPKPPSA